MPARRKPSKAKEAAATLRDDRSLEARPSSARVVEELLQRWGRIADLAIEELASETTVTVVNAGDQLQRHPAVGVFKDASQRIEALLVLADEFGGIEGREVQPGGDDDEPPRIHRGS